MKPRDRSHREKFEALFETEFPSVFRLIDRLSGDPDLATDIAQEALLRLFNRGSMPDSPRGWLATVALNLFRNAEATRSRRRRLLSGPRSLAALSDPPASPDAESEAGQARSRVRAALDAIPERDRSLLLLRAEGLSYREMAQALDIKEASIGTLLARAKTAFREAYEGGSDAS